MHKALLGLILGGVLGAFDGLSALVSSPDVPEVRDGIVGIVAGSTFKGLVCGVMTGFFARKYQSLPLGILFGLGVGCFFAAIIAVMQGSHYLEIILPGSAVGAIVGFATQKYGAAPAAVTAR